MTDPNSDDVDPTARDQREIGREMVEQSTGLGSVTVHAYRDELNQATTWRQRLDRATAAVAAVPGVVGVVTTFLVGVVGLALWPRERHAKGEFREGDPGAWKTGEHDDE